MTKKKNKPDKPDKPIVKTTERKIVARTATINLTGPQLVEAARLWAAANGECIPKDWKGAGFGSNGCGSGPSYVPRYRDIEQACVVFTEPTPTNDPSKQKGPS